MVFGRLSIGVLLFVYVFSAFADSEVVTQFRNPTNEILTLKYTCQKQMQDIELGPGEIKMLPLSECPYWEGYIAIRYQIDQGDSMPIIGSYFARVGEKFILYKLSRNSRIRMETDQGQSPECWSQTIGNYPRSENGSCD